MQAVVLAHRDRLTRFGFLDIWGRRLAFWTLTYIASWGSRRSTSGRSSTASWRS